MVIELTDWVAEAEELWEGAGPATATTARVAAAYRRRRRQQQRGQEGGGGGEEEWGEGAALAPFERWWEDEGEGEEPDDQLPVRIQREVNLLWYELSALGKMAYLGEDAQRRLRQTLVALAAFRTLFEHPGRALRRQSAEECFRQADVNGDGQLSFTEFLRWFRESQQGGDGGVSGSSGGSSGGSTATTALVPFGEGAATRALEGVAMRDLLRRFLAQQEEGEGEDGRGGLGARSEEQVLEDLDRCVRVLGVHVCALTCVGWLKALSP